jgi:hypothetical protein
MHARPDRRFHEMEITFASAKRQLVRGDWPDLAIDTDGVRCYRDGRLPRFPGQERWRIMQPNGTAAKLLAETVEFRTKADVTFFIRSGHSLPVSMSEEFGTTNRRQTIH